MLEGVGIVEAINIDEIQATISEEGYEVSLESENVLKVTDTDSGIVLRAVSEDNILFCTVACLTVSKSSLTADFMERMLAADNGISTSAFQVYQRQDGQVAITLNNFCKLQSMGADDRDDILSCLEFLVADVCTARGLLNDLN